MITTIEEYLKSLGRITDENIEYLALLLPSYENIYDVDLNTRTIHGPNILSIEKDHAAETIYFALDRFVDGIDLAMANCTIYYISPKGEIKYYAVPFIDSVTYNVRYSETGNIVGDPKYIKAYVTYANFNNGAYYVKNENNEYVRAEGVFDPQAEYYSYVDSPKILIPWLVSAQAADGPGELKYAIQFFKRKYDNKGEKVLDTYVLNTKVATTRILEGFDAFPEALLDSVELYDLMTLQNIQNDLNHLKNEEYELYWIEA